MVQEKTLVESKVEGPADVARMRATCEAATPGPWPLKVYAAEDIGRDDNLVPGDAELRIPGLPMAIGFGAGQAATDAVFIAAAREDLPLVLDELRSLRARAESAEAALAQKAKTDACTCSCECCGPLAPLREDLATAEAALAKVIRVAISVSNDAEAALREADLL
jgi:hypothetical protein